MDNITRLTVHELAEKLDKRELTSEEIVKAYKDRIEDKEQDVQAFITTTLDEALEEAKRIDGAKGEEANKLAGIPIGIKDNLCTKGVKTTDVRKLCITI